MSAATLFSGTKRIEEMDKVITTYAKRLVIMQTTERGWIAEAYGSPIGQYYDALLEKFDESNDEEIAFELTNAVLA